VGVGEEKYNQGEKTRNGSTFKELAVYNALLLKHAKSTKRLISKY
jgi:hypothetical protein